MDVDFIDQQVCCRCENDMFWSRMRSDTTPIARILTSRKFTLTRWIFNCVLTSASLFICSVFWESVKSQLKFIRNLVVDKGSLQDATLPLFGRFKFFLRSSRNLLQNNLCAHDNYTKCEELWVKINFLHVFVMYALDSANEAVRRMK